jgi:hypothetical protein
MASLSAVGGAGASGVGVLVYDNVGGGSQAFYAGQAREEAIDDVHGQGRGILSLVEFEYNEPDAAVTDLEAWLSIYDNPRGTDAGLVPLLESVPVGPLQAGRHAMQVPIPDGPLVGPNLWVGVRFSSRSAGLVIQERPALGSSHDYYLENGSFFWFAGRPIANFALRIEVEAIPVATTMIALDDVQVAHGAGDLLEIPDTETGAGELLVSLGAGFTDAKALASIPPRSSVSVSEVADRVFVVDGGRLLRMDGTTRQAIDIGAIGIADIAGIAFHPDETLYGVTRDNKLVRIDHRTGAGTVVADSVVMEYSLSDIAFRPDGRAYVLAEGAPAVYAIQLDDGSTLGKWVVAGSQWPLDSLLWSRDGTLLYSVMLLRSSNRLVGLDLPEASAIGTIAFTGREEIGFAKVESLAWLSQSAVHSLFPDATATGPQPPPTTRLYPNRPNPFNPTTQIDFDLTQEEVIAVTIHDVTGREIATLLQSRLPPGRYHVTWSGRSGGGLPVASGVYFYSLSGAGWRETRSMVLIH